MRDGPRVVLSHGCVLLFALSRLVCSEARARALSVGDLRVGCPCRVDRSVAVLTFVQWRLVRPEDYDPCILQNERIDL